MPAPTLKKTPNCLCAPFSDNIYMLLLSFSVHAPKLTLKLLFHIYIMTGNSSRARADVMSHEIVTDFCYLFLSDIVITTL